jgi:hypothetical protein
MIKCFFSNDKAGIAMNNNHPTKAQLWPLTIINGIISWYI